MRRLVFNFCYFSLSEIPKEVSITANVGTLKRRLQAKAFLEKQNEDYVDEIFDSTPFRNSRKRKVGY